MLQAFWQDDNTPSIKGMDRVAEEVRKQRRMMGRLVSNMETESHSKVEEKLPSNS